MKRGRKKKYPLLLSRGFFDILHELRRSAAGTANGKKVLSTSLKIVVSGPLLVLIVKKTGPEQVLQYLHSGL
jgi:hypothetical protein